MTWRYSRGESWAQYEERLKAMHQEQADAIAEVECPGCGEAPGSVCRYFRGRLKGAAKREPHGSRIQELRIRRNA